MSVAFYGDYNTTETVVIPFNTFSSNDPSASVTVTDLVAGDLMIHKDGGTTQRTSSAGVTVSVNFDTITGNHIASIDLSDNTDAGFYSDGSRYQVRMEGATVDAGTINAWIGSFSIGCVLRPTTNGRTLDVSSTGGAGLDWANIGSPATSVALTGTTVDLVPATVSSLVDDVWDEVLTGGTHNVTNSSGRRLRSIQEFQGYEGGAVWVDTINGTAGTTPFENGTAENAVLTWADALTIAASVGLQRFEIINGSTITLTANSDNFTLCGENWILVLNGQSIATASFEGSIDVSGVSSGNDVRIQRCHLKTCSIGNVWASDCRIGGTITLINTGGHFFQSCYAATGTLPIIDLGSAVGAQTLCLTPLTGGVQVNNILAGDLVHIEGQGEILLDPSCTAGTLEYAGDFRLTDNSATTTVNPDDNTVNLADVLLDTTSLNDTKIPDTISLSNINAEVDTALDTNISELSQGAPSSTPTVRTALMLLYMALRNRLDVNTSGSPDVLNIYNNAGTVITKKQVTDDGSDYSEAQTETGP